MKLSLNIQDDNQNPPLLKAKLPISILNQPFTSIFTTTTTSTNLFSHLSFSLSTNFPSGPSLKLNYSPPPPTTTATPPTLPFSLSLKSGLGLFGSPHNSPLVFTANFTLCPSSSSPISPSFSLHFKPQLGHFSLCKKTHSLSVSDRLVDVNNEANSAIKSESDSGSPSKSELGNGFSSDGSLGWQELKLEPCTGKQKLGFDENIDFAKGVLTGRELVWRESKKSEFFSGIGVKARTVLPLTDRVRVNLKWGLNLPSEISKLPYLTITKIGVDRVGEVKKSIEQSISDENSKGDSELIKGMSFWLRRDLEALEKENRDMRQTLEELKSTRNSHAQGNGGAPTSDSYAKLEQWRKKKADEEGNTKRETKKPVNPASDLESELQKAIKAASY